MVKHLQLKSRSDLSLKKYTNCVLVVVDNIAVIWHYSGRVYFGGWRYEVLDEGCRSGLGLEWVPNGYVYYGEFKENKRNGVGIMKDSE